MDALSIAASLAALIGVVDNVAKGCRKLLALKHAPQILQQLNDELSDFQFVIATVEDVCREQEALETGRCFSQELLSAAIHRAKDAILDLEKMEAYGLLKTPDHRNPKIDFKFWIRNESKLREMRERLRHAKVDILVAFNADDMRWRTKFQVSLVQLAVSNERLLSHQQRLEEMIRTVIQPPHTPRDLNVPEIDSQPEGESQQLEISPINPLISAEASSSIIQSIDLRITRVMVCGCFCPCSCHRKRYFKSPTFLNQVLGSLFVGYNALPFLTTPCDSPQCRRNALSTTSLYYTFPHWFLDRIVAMKSRHPGPDLQLKVLRIRPNDSEIFSAVVHQNTSKVREILAAGDASVLDVNEEGESLLTIALIHGGEKGPEFLDSLVKIGVDMYQEDTRSMSAYLYFWRKYLFSQNSRFMELKSVFGRELQLELFGLTKLHAAVLGVDHDAVMAEDTIRMAPRDTIDEVDQTGRSALSWACAQGDLNKVESLLRKGADPNLGDSEGRTPLHHTSYSINERCVEVLLESGAAAGPENRRGGTPLHDITHRNRCTNEILEIFVRFEANIDVTDGNGWTPLHWAVRHGNVETIDALLRHGANLELQSDMGATPLTYALSRHQYHAFKHLLQVGADFTVKSRKGSLLHFVARDGDAETLRYLRQIALAGIDPNERDNDGLTALEHAERRRDGVIEYTDMATYEAPPIPEPLAWFEAFVSVNQMLRNMELEDEEVAEAASGMRSRRRYSLE